MTLEEMQNLSEEEQKKLFERLHKIRHLGKTTNYSSQYGVGAPKLARTLEVEQKEAKKLLEAYWKINWAIREGASRQRVKRVRGQDWIYNPVSKFWYSLRNEKDRWSTLVQGTGVYCFDLWIREIRKKRPQLTATFHDECVFEIKKGHRKECEKLLRDSLQKVNNRLKLNVTLDCEVQFGENYACVH